MNHTRWSDLMVRVFFSLKSFKNPILWKFVNVFWHELTFCHLKWWEQYVRLKAYVHVVPVTCWICWIPLLHSQHVSTPSVGQTNMDGNKLTSSTFYSEVHFEYHMTAESSPSSSFFKKNFQILVDFQDFWGFQSKLI